MEFENINNSDLKILNYFSSKDMRGSFSKFYTESVFKDIESSWEESFISSSKRNVFRGFHLQVNHGSHSKLVTCISGTILDFIIDLRFDKGSFGKIFSIELDSKTSKSIYIPRGYAHAFYNPKEEEALVLYLTSKEYDPDNDTGVKWSSVNYDWPFSAPIVSPRDNELQTLGQFRLNEYSY